MLLSLTACGNNDSARKEATSDSGAKTADSSEKESEAKDSSSGSSEDEAAKDDALKASGSSESKDAPKVVVEFSSTNSWEGEKGNYTQYDVVVYNNDSSKITDWSIDAKCPDDMVLDQNWNTTVSVGGGKINIVPADYAKSIDAGAKTEGLGIIVADSKGDPLSEYEITYSLESGESMTLAGMSGEASWTTVAMNDSSGKSTKVSTDANSNNPNKNTQNSSNENSNGSANNTNDSITNQTDTNDSSQNKGDTNVATGTAKVTNTLSKLHVEGTSLMNEKGEHVQLQGISTLGLAWFPQYVDEATFKTFKDDWGINVVRLAMYTQEDGGYCVGDDANRQKLKDLIDKGVNAATDLGLYVIIDWHILSDGNPLTHEDQAIPFFDEMSKKYASYDNVIYEICNEPNGSNWSSEIRPYAEKIIPVIRKNAPDSVIIVGTNTWSQDVDDVISDPINEKNLVYTVHFYAATHKENIRNKAQKALDAGIPVFVSECSICDASGNGGLDKASADEWKNFINENGISFIEWSLSNKNESSAILVPSCTKTSGFTDSDYTDSAKYYRQWMRENAGLE